MDTYNTAVVMKLLRKLNREEGITLVMVTHDVNLKYFADKIVWMRDGLVQRVEDVSRAQQEEAAAKLFSELDENTANAQSVNKKKTQEVVTEIREPTFYEAVAFSQQYYAEKEREKERALLAMGLSANVTVVPTKKANTASPSQAHSPSKSSSSSTSSSSSSHSSESPSSKSTGTSDSSTALKVEV